MDLDDESNVVAQLEEIFRESGNWPNLDNLVPNASQSQQDQSNEQLVIDDIKRRLMSEDPLIPPHQQQQPMNEEVIDSSGAVTNRQALQVCSYFNIFLNMTYICHMS